MTTTPTVVNSVKAKLDAMTQGKNLKSLIWRPTRGKEESVRIVPYRHGPDPFNELYFHYDIGPVKTILCPHSAGSDPCPICDYAQFLLKGEKSDKTYALYKRLKSRIRVYIPVIVRGGDDSIKFWGVGRSTYQAIGQLFIDPEYGDISDPLKGRDLKILATNPTPQYIYGQVNVRPAANSSLLNLQATTAKQLIVDCPSVFDAFQKMTTLEIQNVLDVFIAQGDTEASVDVQIPEDDQPSMEEELKSVYEEIQKNQK